MAAVEDALISKQLAWQRKKQAEGMCPVCGKNPLSRMCVSGCRPCLRKKAAKNLARYYAKKAGAVALLLLTGCSLPIAAPVPFAGGTREYECFREAQSSRYAQITIHANWVDWEAWSRCMNQR